jgi:TPR repeat protein
LKGHRFALARFDKLLEVKRLSETKKKEKSLRLFYDATTIGSLLTHCTNCEYAFKGFDNFECGFCRCVAYCSAKCKSLHWQLKHGKKCKKYGLIKITWMESIAEESKDKSAFVGDYYANGWCTSKNEKMAFKFYNVAAENGDFLSFHRVAKCFINGFGVEKDYINAFQVLSKAHKFNVPNTYFWLGLMYMNAIGTCEGPNHDKALKMFKADNHIGNAIKLYKCYVNGSESKQIAQELDIPAFSCKFPVHLDNAMTFLMRAAHENDIEANFLIATVHKKQFQMDNLTLFNCLSIASDGGHASAHFELGMYYYSGTGTIKNLDKAFQLFMLNIEKGETDAHFFLGRCYEYGYGTDIDLTKSYKHYLLASSTTSSTNKSKTLFEISIQCALRIKSQIEMKMD